MAQELEQYQLQNQHLPEMDGLFHEQDIPNGLAVIKEHLLAPGGLLLLDLDDTVKEATKFTWPDGIKRRVLPETIAALRVVHQHTAIGITTEQAVTEIEPWITDVAKLVLRNEEVNPYELFNGHISGEGGNVIRNPNKVFKRPLKDGEGTGFVVVTPSGALAQRQEILHFLESDIMPIQDHNGWKRFSGLDPEQATYVDLPEDSAQGIATISIWEQGKHVSQDPVSADKYRLVKAYVDGAKSAISILNREESRLTSYEAGNGTLRLASKQTSKARIITLLTAAGGFHPETTAFFCDGPNDVTLAQYLKAHGGTVGVVSNAVPQLHALADYSATQDAGLGFAEAIQIMFPEKYATAWEELQQEMMHMRIHKFTEDLEQIAPDLKSNNLAHYQAQTLFQKLWEQGARTETELIEVGVKEWYMVGKDILGPLASYFVDHTTRHVDGVVIYPARDATPFYIIAQAFKETDPIAYPAEIRNDVFNRKLWGVNDEQDSGDVLTIDHPLVQQYLVQMGLLSGKPITFVEVGAYGTMANALKESFPDLQFGIHFFFSQVPFIEGFINAYKDELPQGATETIADTFEGLPKPLMRPTQLVTLPDGLVDVSTEGKKVDSPYLDIWQNALFQGLQHAAVEYLQIRDSVDTQEFIHQELVKIQECIIKSREGIFTGILPTHTETWSGREQWIAEWQIKWGNEKLPTVGVSQF